MSNSIKTPTRSAPAAFADRESTRRRPSFISLLKRIATKAPRPLGDLSAQIPYSARPGFGGDYRRARATRRWFDETATPDEKRDFVFQRVRRVVEIAVAEVPFYRRYYAENDFSLADLRSFDDIQKIPIVSKAILRDVPLEERSRKVPGRSLAFTGGSTGEPFAFYADKRQIGNEWAHLHYIWGRFGFRSSDLKLNLALDETAPPLYYNGLRHELVLNVFHPRETLPEAFLRLPRRRRDVRFIRAYPSALADFLDYCDNNAPDVLAELQKTLRATFLVSEYPSPQYRKIIERTTNRPTQSFYGHSERTILAWERSRPFLFETAQSYGYCETTRDADGFESLVGTAYWNFASPLIRYRVDDGVRPVAYADGMLAAFEILQGRRGDYIIDKTGAKFSITHLNLSCREETWKLVRSVQVEQREPGKAIFWVVPRRETTIRDVEKAFAFGGLNLDCEFRLVSKPFLTKIGKTPLKVSTAGGKIIGDKGGGETSEIRSTT